MATVRTWWQRLTGHAAETRTSAAAPKAAPKPVKTAGLELAEAPAKKKPARVGAAGFDPYASDAGFAKPHSWERVDHD